MRFLKCVLMIFKSTSGKTALFFLFLPQVVVSSSSSSLSDPPLSSGEVSIVDDAAISKWYNSKLSGKFLKSSRR